MDSRSSSDSEKQAIHHEIRDVNETEETSVSYTKFSDQDILSILPGSEDDEDMPACTLRMWILTMVVGTVVSAVDSFFNMRFPSVSISVIVILMVTWPLGHSLHLLLPNWTIRLPFNQSIALNPGPFNYKEHACIFIFTNTTTEAFVHLIIEDTAFFKARTGIGRQILITMSMYIISFSSMGLARNILVTPDDQVWPGLLSRIALSKSFHSKDNPVANGWTISRMSFFWLVFAGSFTWYWVPDLLMPFTSTIGAWISWIKPDSPVSGQVFGVKNGSGLFPFTLDWTQITTINNPSTTPFWAVACIFLSFVFWIWIVMPGLYYQNHWNTAHLPIMTNKVFTYKKKNYDFEKVVNKNWTLDPEKFARYSPAILPIAFLINLSLGIGSFAAVVVHFLLTCKQQVIEPLKQRDKQSDRFGRVMTSARPFPTWVYSISMAAGLGMGFGFSAGWDDAPMKADEFIVSIVIGVALFVPSSLVEARANITISIDVFFYIVGSNWFNGNPLHLLYFRSIGFGALQHAMRMTQSAKFGHYMRIKPTIYMPIIFLSGIWASSVGPAVCWYLSNHIDGICTEDAENNMTCRKQKTSFNTQGIWGLFGDHLFAPGGRYVWVLWFFSAGALVPIFQFLIVRWKPKSILAQVDPVSFFGGAERIPGVTGFNYSTWFVTAFIFNWVIHKKFTAWWRKYNLVTSIGLDCGVAITIIIVYFAVVYTGASKHLTWWGSEVDRKGCDAKGCPYLSGPIPRPTSY